MFSSNGYLFLFFTEDTSFATIYDRFFTAVYIFCRFIVMILAFFYLNGVGAMA
jgi:hypothetical protein